MEFLDFEIGTYKESRTCVAGYARLQTDLEGRVMNITELHSASMDNYFFVEECQDYIIDAEFIERDCDLLVTIHIVTENIGGWECIEYDSWCEFPHVIVLQQGYKKILENTIRKYDTILYKSGELISGMISLQSDDVSYSHSNNMSCDPGDLLELHDLFLSTYDESIDLASYPIEEEEL